MKHSLWVSTQYPRGTSFPQIWKFLNAPFPLLSSCLPVDQMSDGHKSSKFTSTSALPFRHLPYISRLKQWRKNHIRQRKVTYWKVLSVPPRRMMSHQKLQEFYKRSPGFWFDHLKHMHKIDGWNSLAIMSPN